MQTLQVSIHVVAHSGLAVGIGTVLERIFPVYNEGKPSILQILEAGTQLVVSAAIMSETMRILSPSGANYVSPIGDGFAANFLLDSQPNLRMKLYRGINLAMKGNMMDIDRGTTGATSPYTSSA